MTNPVNAVGNPILPRNQIEIAELKLKRKLGIEDNTTVPIGPVPTVSTSYVNPLTGKVMINGVEASQIYADEEALAEDDVVSEASQTQEAKKSNTNQTQSAVVEKIINKYNLKENNVEYFEDGSAKITMSNSNKSELVIDKDGNILSAKNVTGKMLREYLFKDNDKLISAVKELVSGESTKEKIDNFNRGSFDISTDSNGNLNIIYVKGYEKPQETAKNDDNAENTVPKTTTTDIYGNVIEVDDDTISYIDNPTVEISDNTENTVTYVMVTPDGTVKKITPTYTPEAEAQETQIFEPVVIQPQKEADEQEVVTEENIDTETQPAITETEEDVTTPQQIEEAPSAEDVEITPETAPAEEAVTAETEPNEPEETKLIDDETLTAVMSYVVDKLGIEGYDEASFVIAETKDGKHNIEIKFKSQDGETHSILYSPKSKVVISIDNQKGFTEANAGANEVIKAVPDLEFKDDKTQSEKNKDVYSHNNVSVIIMRSGTSVSDTKLMLDDKIIDGSIIKSDEVNSKIPSDVLSKINEVLGENKTADSTVFIENNYFDWGRKTEYKVVQLKDTVVNGNPCTASVIYTFSSNGELKKIEYNGQEIDIYASKNAANVFGMTIDEMLFSSTNIDNEMTRTTIEVKQQDGTIAKIDLCDDEWMHSNNVYAQNLNHEQVSKVLYEDAIAKMKSIIENFAGNKIENGTFSIYSAYDLEANPIVGAEQYYEAIVCEVNGYKFIFEPSAMDYCTIIDPNGNINRDYEFDY